MDIIAAAEANNSGIIFFPPGKFHINEPTDNYNQPIYFYKSHIIILGSGNGPGGTELFMNRHMDPKDPLILFSSIL